MIEPLDLDAIEAKFGVGRTSGVLQIDPIELLACTAALIAEVRRLRGILGYAANAVGRLAAERDGAEVFALSALFTPHD